MKLSLNWLKEYIEISEDPQTLGELITMHIAEVEEVVAQAEEYEHIVVGTITEIMPHPDADKLQLCAVAVGDKHPAGTVQIVCGGSNLAVNQNVVVALPGSKVRWHGEGDLVELKKTKIRGEKSFGMICGADEVGLLERYPKQVETEIVDLGANFASAGTPLSDALNLDDIIIDIDNKTLTHRADLFNHLGFARELSVVLKRELKLPAVPAVKSVEPTIEFSVTADPALCNRYKGVVLENITVQPSPQWMQQRLQTIGVAVINNVVDITNYVMYEFGQPLHAFDFDTLQGGTVIVRNSNEGEMLTTLDKKERTFDAVPTPIIADAEKPVALAGMMGGMNSEIGEGTTRIALESANFNPIAIRKGAQHQGVRTDGSTRHEKKLGIEFPELGFQRAVQLLQEHAGATVASAIIDEGEYSLEQTVISNISLVNDVERLIGISIVKPIVQRVLEGLGVAVEFATDDLFTVTVPLTRTDLRIKEDIIEEIARMHGYENIEPQPLLGSIEPPVIQADLLVGNSIVSMMTTWGAREMMNYSFYSAEDVAKIGGVAEDHISIVNPMNPNQQFMRQTTVPSLLHNIRKNLNNRYKDFTLVEYGHLYFTGLEFNTVSVAIHGESEEVFFKAKGYVESIMSELHVTAIYDNLLPDDERENHNYQIFDPAADGVYNSKGDVQLATVGVMNAEITEAFGIEGVVAIAVLHLPRIAELATSHMKFQTPSKYPSIDLDISIEVESDVQWSTVEKTITDAAGTMLKNVQLFDVYSGDKVDDNKKALGIRMWLQSMERTLEMSEAEHTRETVIAALQEKLSAKHRV